MSAPLLKREIPRRRFQMISVAVLCFALAGFSALMWSDGLPFAGAVGFFMFALFGAGFGWMLLGGVGATLDGDGLTIRRLFHRQRYRWTEVSEFRVYRRLDLRIPFLLSGIAFDVRGASVGRGAVKTENIQALMISGALEKTCDLLNHYRATALVQ